MPARLERGFAKHPCYPSLPRSLGRRMSAEIRTVEEMPHDALQSRKCEPGKKKHLPNSSVKHVISQGKLVLSSRGGLLFRYLLKIRQSCFQSTRWEAHAWVQRRSALFTQAMDCHGTIMCSHQYRSKTTSRSSSMYIHVPTSCNHRVDLHVVHAQEMPVRGFVAL